MKALDQQVWDQAIRQHDRKVFLSLLALGLTPDRAREVAQTAWTKLMEQHASGGLAELRFPGLAIKQARYIALNEAKREQTGLRVLAAVPNSSEPASLESEVGSRQELGLILDALATCSPMAKRIFRLVYAEPHHSHAEAAKEVGLSLQRVRQILCETRKQIKNSVEGRA
jgi:RNA polymerase sigma-70 factor (ECF subfamily)